MAENRLLDLLQQEAYGPAADPRKQYSEPNTYLARGLLPTLPLASFEADSVRMPEAPDSLPTRALHAIADAMPKNKELPEPQFPMDPRSMSALRMAEEAFRHSGNWAGWQSKTRPEDYSPGDVLAPSGLTAMGALAARPAATMARPKEWPTAAAIRWGDDHVFTGPNHARVLMDADLRNVPHSASPTDGFVTNTGRFISRQEASNMTGMPRVIRNGMVSEALENLDPARDMAKRTGQGFATTLTADSSRASLPGTIVNGLEQGSKPTAGATPLSPRQLALEQGREQFHAAGPNWLESGERLSPLGTEHAGGPASVADHALRKAGGDYEKALALLGNSPASNVLRYWHSEGANFRSYADPAQAHNYWRGADDFKFAEAPSRLNADNARASSVGVIAGGIDRKPARTLEEYVDSLQARPSVLDYETYLSDPMRTINGRSRTFETQEPAFKRDVSQEAKNLDHWRNLDSLREKRDAGLMAGPEGNPVNPWYWPAPLYDAFKRELGPELAHERLSKFMNYNASTSMQTAVPRNIIEAGHVLYNDIHDIPMSRLNASELTGAATNNKVNISGQIASGEGIKGETERILSPTTLDSIMAEAMRLRKQSGEPAERFRGPIYRQGVGTINKLGEEVGAAAADTQAAIWQQHQMAKHGDPVYGDSHARIFDDVIHRIARQRGEDPKKALADFINGTQRPPNAFFSPENK